jgi:hypothetical protein
MATLEYQDDEKDSFPAGKSRYPTNPSAWDRVKEAFEPTAQRIMIEQIRKRRQAAAGR